MFESVHGRLAAKEPSRVVVETGGVGWLVQVALGDYDALPRVGEEVRLLLHVEPREDGWRVFGFLRSEHREAFRRLLRVKGVGPLTAMTILSGIGPADLEVAVAAGDTEALRHVKGIGKKTADLIVAELKEDARRGLIGGTAGAAASRAAPSPAGPVGDAVKALMALGLDAIEARRRVDAVKPGKDAAVAAIVRAALRV